MVKIEDLIDHEEGDTDLMRHRKLILKNNVIHFKQDGQYGLWTVNFDKGQVPERLKGQYTSPQLALDAVNVYLRDKNRLEEVK